MNYIKQQKSILKNIWIEYIISREVKSKRKFSESSFQTLSLDEQFENINENESVFREFMEYCRNLLTNENLEFWNTVYNYKLSRELSTAIDIAKKYLGYQSGEGLLYIEDRFQLVKIFSQIEDNRLELDMFDLLVNDIKSNLKFHWTDFCANNNKTKKPPGIQVLNDATRKLKNSIQILRKKNDIDLYMYYNYLFCEDELYTSFHQFLEKKNLHYYLDFMKEIHILNIKSIEQKEDFQLSLKYLLLDLLENYFNERKINIPNIRNKLGDTKKKDRILTI